MAAAADTLLERPPQKETYGRSLSTIHRLGAYAVERTLDEIIASPEADQARAEFYTSVEEGFGTDAELGGGLKVRDFDERQVIDGKVMSKDLSRPVADMTEAGLTCAEETAEKDKRFLPQLTRSKWDHYNQLQVDAMARGKTDYNTRIVASPFPEEAAARSGDEYWQHIGYVPSLRRGFVQMFHADGEIVVGGSLSFDGSNKHRLREVFKQFGKDIPEGEITDNWLAHAMTGNMSLDEAKELATAIADAAGETKPEKTTNTVDVTREHKAIMDRVFDSSYVHVCESLFRGYQTEATVGLVRQLANEAPHFNERYAAALYGMRANQQRFTDDDAIVLHELLVYSTIELMRALHLDVLTVPVYTDDFIGLQPQVNYTQIDQLAFQAMLGGFGAEGARQGRTYSACGLAISLGGEGQSEGLQTAFGGLEQTNNPSEAHGPGQDKYGSLEFYCKNGHWNRRPRNQLITQCRIKSCKNSVSC